MIAPADDEREPAHECGNCGDFKWMLNADCPVGTCLAFDRSVLAWDEYDCWWSAEGDEDE